MMIPKPVYESLPILYVVGGIAAMTTVDSFMSFFSGVLLGVSGVVVLFLRRHHRTDQRQEQWLDRPRPIARVDTAL